MTVIVHSLSSVKRKLKFGIFIPKKITLKPKSLKAVISDLFPIRNDSDWKTEFELLNVPGLIKGDNNTKIDHSVTLYFFDDNGNLLGNKHVFMNSTGRQTINLSEFLKNELSEAKTFALFHDYDDYILLGSGSFLAERGYTGYEYKNSGVKGYVHGNLDAVALSGTQVQPLGNKSYIARTYTVQHQLIGPAKYEFIFTNPTSNEVVIKPLLSGTGNNWVAQKYFRIPSLGARLYSIDLNKENTYKVKFKSRLYLGRPVVFRTCNESMDVFHG